MKSYSLASLSHFLRTPFNNFTSRLFLFLVKRLSHQPSMSLTVSYESTVIYTTAKHASLPIAASSSMDHGYQHGIWRENIWGSGRSTGSLTSGIPDHEHPHGFWQYHKPWNSALSPAEPYNTDNNGIDTKNIWHIILSSQQFLAISEVCGTWKFLEVWRITEQKERLFFFYLI